MKYFYNNEFEVIDTPEKAYVLGLYYADGFVTYHPEKHNYFTAISLHIKDKELLQSIKNHFPFFNLVHTEPTQYKLRLNQKIVCEHLMANGVLPNKSIKNKNKLRFPDIPTSLYSHFIRGYFDGDGSIFFSKTMSPNTKGFSITSSNYFLLKKIKEIFYYEGIDVKLNHIRGGHSIIRGKRIEFKLLTFSLVVQNKSTILKIADYLYKDATLYMKRKIWKFYYNFYPVKIRNKCPRCGSYNTRTEQLQSNDTIIFCKDCKRWSTYGHVYYDNLKPDFCKHCGADNFVKNGKVYSRTDNRLIGVQFLCRNCNRGTSVKLTAPLYGNV